MTNQDLCGMFLWDWNCNLFFVVNILFFVSVLFWYFLFAWIIYLFKVASCAWRWLLPKNLDFMTKTAAVKTKITSNLKWLRWWPWTGALKQKYIEDYFLDIVCTHFLLRVSGGVSEIFNDKNVYKQKYY